MEYLSKQRLGWNDNSGLYFTRKNGKAQVEGNKLIFPMNKAPQAEYINPQNEKMLLKGLNDKYDKTLEKFEDRGKVKLVPKNMIITDPCNETPTLPVNAVAMEQKGLARIDNSLPPLLK
jgi:hypothetical protein